jgi:hypothetical protein
MKNKLEFVVRVYTPKDPFHPRKTYWEKRRSGELFAQIALFDWALLIGWFEIIPGMPHIWFLVVGFEDDPR